MTREANPVVANATRARVPARAVHSSLGLRCGKWCSRGRRSEVEANLSTIEGVANV